jgi:hypothetical protein
MVTIKRNLDIRVNGNIFVKAHLSRIFNKKSFENYTCQGDWNNAKYALDLSTQPQFNTHFKLFKSLNDVRKFISQNF